MSVSLELRSLINQFEKMADHVIAKAARTNPEALQNYVSAVAGASLMLEKAANSTDGQITEDMLDELVLLAETLDQNADPRIRKQATVLDELLLTLAAPKNSVVQAKIANEDEINRLREKYRTSQREDVYKGPKEALDKQNLVDKTRKAVDEKVKTFEPLEAPLQTRYSPDTPGSMTTRVADGVYQDVTTGKQYDYNNGYTTNKGNKIPGSSVDQQIPDLGDYQEGQNLFETREALMSRSASDNGLSAVFKALRKNAEDDEGLARLKNVVEVLDQAGISVEQFKDALLAVKNDDGLDEKLAMRRLAQPAEPFPEATSEEDKPEWDSMTRLGPEAVLKKLLKEQLSEESLVELKALVEGASDEEIGAAIESIQAHNPLQFSVSREKVE